MRKIFSALDIGSNSIKLVVAEFIKNKIHILLALKKTSFGFKHNTITDKESLKTCINLLLDEAESKLNFRPSKMILNIPTDYNSFKMIDYNINIDREDHIINSNDILKVLKESTINNASSNEEMIANIPVIFKVGATETDRPFGKEGNTLSVKSVIVSADKRKIYELINFLSELKLEIIDITTTGLVDYLNFKTPELDNKNVVVVNLGDTSTNISVFSKGVYINNQTLDIGGIDIDREIALTFNLRKKEATYLKEHLSLAVMQGADVKEKCEVETKDGEVIKINQYELSKVSSKKLEETLKIVKNSINHLTKKEISYIIITGGLAEIRDFPHAVNMVFGKTAKVGNINNIGARDNSYSVAVGMLIYFNEKLSLRNRDFSAITGEEVEAMMQTGKKNVIAEDSILGKVVSYFFDN